MVMVDMLSKEAYIVPFKSTHKTYEILEIFMRDILRFHGLPKEIESNKDTKLTSIFFKSHFQDLGTKLNFSMTNHL